MSDPRKRASPKTVNQILLDREIRHAIYLTRLGGSEAKWLNKKLPQLRRDVSDAIASEVVDLPASGPISKADAQAIDRAAKKAGQATQKFFQQVAKEHETRMGDVAVAEADFEKRLLEKTWPIDRNFKLPPEAKLRSIMANRPISGKTILQWFDGMPLQTIEAVNEQLRQGILAGESVNDLMRRIRGRRENGFKDGIIGRQGQQAENLVRTGVMKASNDARAQFHEANKEVIKGFEWVLTLDDRTCEICAAGEAQNPYPAERPPQLPAHIKCRCVFVAVTKSWEELGIDLEEMDPGTRASMDGQVPEPMTYQEWFDQQPASRQLDILGPGRFNSYQNGVPVTAFADNGKALTLKQIQALEADLGVPGIGGPVANTGPRTDDFNLHQEQARRYLNGLPVDSRRVVSDYTADGYVNWNKMLRGETPSNLSERGLEWTKDDISRLKQLLGEAPGYEGLSYRGTRLSDNVLAQFKKDGFVTMDAFTSTSLERTKALEFTEFGTEGRSVLFEILGRNGTHIDSLSVVGHEKEILFNAGTKFRVLSRGETPGGDVLIKLAEV